MNEEHVGFISGWAEVAKLSEKEIDCATAVMLKILDGKCKMNPVEKEIMEAVYHLVKMQPGLHLQESYHQLIKEAIASPTDDMKERVYEQRVLAETMISRPVMKAFKARLRKEKVLPAKLSAEE